MNVSLTRAQSCNFERVNTFSEIIEFTTENNLILKLIDLFICPSSVLSCRFMCLCCN